MKTLTFLKNDIVSAIILNYNMVRSFNKKEKKYEKTFNTIVSLPYVSFFIWLWTKG